MRADSTFVNMKDVDITDQGPDMGNNDMAAPREEGSPRTAVCQDPRSPLFFKGKHICIILRVWNFFSSPLAYFNAAANQSVSGRRSAADSPSAANPRSSLWSTAENGGSMTADPGPGG